MNNKKMKVSLILNIIIFILTVTAATMMFTGFKFMGDDVSLAVTKFAMFHFFTVDSNVLMGITALLFAIQEIAVLKGKKEVIAIKLHVLKLISTVGVGLTFVTVIVYLGPISEGGIPSMLKNSNLFFHFIIPVLSIVNLILFEKTDKIKFKYTFLGVITMLIYAIYYITNILIHMENGKVSPKYDWYWFVQGGVWQIVIVVPLMLGITYLISLTLWRLNKK